MCLLLVIWESWSWFFGGWTEFHGCDNEWQYFHLLGGKLRNSPWKNQPKRRNLVISQPWSTEQMSNCLYSKWTTVNFPCAVTMLCKSHLSDLTVYKSDCEGRESNSSLNRSCVCFAGYWVWALSLPALSKAKIVISAQPERGKRRRSCLKLGVDWPQIIDHVQGVVAWRHSLLAGENHLSSAILALETI